MKIVCAIIEEDSKILITKNNPDRPLGAAYLIK